MKIIVAPDKFKGSLSSFEVCEAMAAGIRESNPQAQLCLLPMADGGDGFAGVMRHYCQTRTIKCETADPLGRPLTASYEWDEINKTAIIEMAVASGMVLLEESERNPLHTSTLGTGLMVRDAISRSADKIILGLGGSATNDAGIGILTAMGFAFLDDKNKPLLPIGKSLTGITKIIRPPLIPRIKFQIACDVDNPLFGINGAAYIYGPQKGANEIDVELLDQGLRNFAAIVVRETGRDVATVAGSGAAGGIAAGLMAFFPVDMRKGIELVAEVSKLHEEMHDTDIVITGEGRIDEQSAQGKVVGYLSMLAKENGLPCYGVCGQLSLDDKKVAKLGLAKVLSLKSIAGEKDPMRDAAALLKSIAPGLLDL